MQSIWRFGIFRTAFFPESWFDRNPLFSHWHTTNKPHILKKKPSKDSIFEEFEKVLTSDQLAADYAKSSYSRLPDLIIKDYKVNI